MIQTSTISVILGQLLVLSTTVLSARAPGVPAPVYGPPPSLAEFMRPPPPSGLSQDCCNHSEQLQFYQYPRYQPYPTVKANFQKDYNHPPHPQQQYRTEIQGIWRYSSPMRAPPVREQDVPFQGLGASNSVTMPEAPVYDPLLVTGSHAARFVEALHNGEPYYFPNFPHTRLVLRNQQHRLQNNLPANRLGSIRPGSDFIRRN